ncbi:hypothetical protein FUAX_20240 [Fulvitalea axinellae]|uniref:UspA domain-containing protein n=1 Tax=Fulvitalea axinellae TaxID=1182444 RepID=A0AAU9CW00_9BACT|nr:hypothetical protein FUAX_20240 [Fulvitalea axinellae]
MSLEIKKIMIALDLSDMDQQLFEYALILSENIKLDHIYLVHIVKSFDDLDESEKEGDPSLPVDEGMKRLISEKVPAELSKRAEIHIEIHEGPTIKSLLRWSKFKDVDLLVIGHKQDKYHEDYLPAQVANFSKCSVTLVPEVFPKELRRILIPVDFSEHAGFAVKASLFVSKHKEENPEIKLINIYEVPSGYHTIGKSFDEFANIIRTQHEKEFEDFVKKNDFEKEELKCEYILDQKGNIAQAIADYAQENEVDVIVIGAKGRTHLASMLIGSVAKKLIQISSRLPVVVIKQKEDEYNLIDGLWDI